MPFLSLQQEEAEPSNTQTSVEPQAHHVDLAVPATASRPSSLKVRNRRKRYLDANEDYFGPSLELAGLP